MSSTTPAVARPPVTEPILTFFIRSSRDPKEAFALCDAYLQLAERIQQLCSRTPERTVALRKLLESRDAALRTYELPAQPEQR